jgi:hypothetical protein
LAGSIGKDVDSAGDLNDLGDPPHLIPGDRRSVSQAGRSVGGAIAGRGVDGSIDENVDAAGDLDQLRDPPDPGNQRIVPLLDDCLGLWSKALTVTNPTQTLQASP